MHAQTKKNRVVSKHGRLNTFRRYCCNNIGRNLTKHYCYSSDEIHEKHRFLKADHSTNIHSNPK